MIDYIFLYYFTCIFTIYTGCNLFIRRYLTKYNQNRLWSIFTRLASTYNALICVYMACWQLWNRDELFYFWGSHDEWGNLILKKFAAYLFVDGIFLFLDFNNDNNVSNDNIRIENDNNVSNDNIRIENDNNVSNKVNNNDRRRCKYNIMTIFTLLHHLIGGIGIYSIATIPVGFFLGLYFAFTEITTPLLNICWFFYTNKIKNIVYMIYLSLLLILFFLTRIFTIIFLILYESYNRDDIMTSNFYIKNMFYFGNYTLVILNIVWFIMLYRKVRKELFFI